jgi:hypothetical protein
MEKLKRRIEFCNNRLAWAVIGEKGAIHVWCSAYDLTLGGIEIHSREPIWEGQAETSKQCWLLDGKCHHDGSSLQYTERIRFDIGHAFTGSSYPRKPQEDLWLMLAYEYRSRFGCEAEIDWESSVIADTPKGGDA